MYQDLEINHIVAMSDNRVIGRSGGMPWHIPEDFKFFKATTMGHAMIMGRKTWVSIGRPLPGRATVVVSRQSDLKIEGSSVVVPTIEQGLLWCLESAEQWGKSVFIAGGGEIYRQTMNIVDRIYLTHVHAEIQGDTFYPEIPKNFKLTSERPHVAGDLHFSFQTFERKSSSC